MLKFIARRVFLEALPTLLLLATLTFFMIRLAPGGPFSSEMNVPPEVLAHIQARYHLDQPLWQQYLGYLGDLAHGDLGPSFKYKDFTVNELVASSLPVSFRLGLFAFVIALLVGVSAGVVAALRQNTWIDYGVMTIAMTGVVIPNFVLAPILALIFAIWLKILPAGGWEGGRAIYVVLPVAVLCQHYIAVIARITRGSMIEVLGSPFIRTARAKGLPTGYILRRHALKPALLPVLSYLGPAFVGVITGSIVIETFFGIPGIGQLFVNGALNRDYTMVLGLTVLVGTLTILFNAIVDILYGFIDPRIRIH
ncbi:oligopeptide ABC transporter permease OppB [Niveibacterium terrae]|uniref:oligopeptide ABC transporter permease OppB n=1 Tax=Niveibacterium terrae TaxID=3373598 RepID=UPI003A90F8BD